MSTLAGRDLHPTDGARFLLERGDVDGDGCVYRATIYTPTASFAYRARLATSGEVELQPLDLAAPVALHAALAMFAKLTARAAASKIVDGNEPWPARVLRWRADKRQAAV